MVRNRKKQCSVLIFCCTLQCNRGTETIYLEPSKLSLDLSNNLHGKATRRVVLESSFAITSQWIRAEAILNAELCYSQEIANHHFVIFKAPPTLISRATRLKSLQISIRSVNLHGKEQKEAVSCATFLQHFAMHARNGEQ